MAGPQQSSIAHDLTKNDHGSSESRGSITVRPLHGSRGFDSHRKTGKLAFSSQATRGSVGSTLPSQQTVAFVKVAKRGGCSLEWRAGRDSRCNLQHAWRTPPSALGSHRPRRTNVASPFVWRVGSSLVIERAPPLSCLIRPPDVRGALTLHTHAAGIVARASQMCLVTHYLSRARHSLCRKAHVPRTTSPSENAAARRVHVCPTRAGRALCGPLRSR